MNNRIPMRKASVIAMLIAAAAQAQAQTSNVTLYGYLDLGLVKESNATTRLDKGYNNWLGFKGSEDLGGDLSALFNVQMRFNPDTGAQERSTTLFQGETTVGLKSKSMGKLRVGRALTPLWAEKWVYDPWYDSAFMGSLANYNGDFNSDGLPSVDFHNYARVANAVFYSSPSLSGFQLHGEAEVELPTGATTRSKGVSLNYANGPLSAMLSYEKNHVENDIAYLGASYNLDAFTLMGSYSKTSFAAASAKKTSTMLAGTYAIGGDTVRLGYGRIKESGNHKVGLGYNHPLSKRTNVYADIYREKTTDSKNGFAVGMNHTF